MANYATAYGFSKTNTGSPTAGQGVVSKRTVVLDFAKIKAERAAQSQTALAAGDTMEIMDIPKHAVMLQAGMTVVKAEATNTTATFDLGFTGGSPEAANFFANDVASNGAAGTVYATKAVNTIVFTAADTLDLLLNTAVPVDGVYHVWAVLADCSPAS